MQSIRVDGALGEPINGAYVSGYTECCLLNIEDAGQYIDTVISSCSESMNNCINKNKNTSHRISKKLKSFKIIDISNMINYNARKDLLEIITGSLSGNTQVRVNPVLIGNDIYYSRLNISFMHHADKVMFIVKVSSSLLRSIKKSESSNMDFMVKKNLFRQSSVAILYRELNKWHLFENLFDGITWINNDTLLDINNANHIQIYPQMIIVDSIKKVLPYRVFTPYGVLSCSDFSSWVTADDSIRDAFVKLFSDKFKFSLRSNKNKEMFGKPISEINWENEDFINVFTAASLVGATNI